MWREAVLIEDVGDSCGDVVGCSWLRVVTGGRWCCVLGGGPLVAELAGSKCGVGVVFESTECDVDEQVGVGGACGVHPCGGFVVRGGAPAPTGGVRGCDGFSQAVFDETIQVESCGVAVRAEVVGDVRDGDGLSRGPQVGECLVASFFHTHILHKFLIVFNRGGYTHHHDHFFAQNGPTKRHVGGMSPNKTTTTPHTLGAIAFSATLPSPAPIPQTEQRPSGGEEVKVVAKKGADLHQDLLLIKTHATSCLSNRLSTFQHSHFKGIHQLRRFCFHHCQRWF